MKFTEEGQLKPTINMSINSMDTESLAFTNELLKDQIPGVMDSIKESLNTEYKNLIVKHKLDPTKHKPVFSVKNERNKTVITVGISHIDSPSFLEHM